ncbi:MAG: hypothetical protein HY606_04395 [Planctomycetes bacterium]|nr:hypothetical protein [Planctomycetota bacterium]
MKRSFLITNLIVYLIIGIPGFSLQDRIEDQAIRTTYYNIDVSKDTMLEQINEHNFKLSGGSAVFNVFEGKLDKEIVIATQDGKIQSKSAIFNISLLAIGRDGARKATMITVFDGAIVFKTAGYEETLEQGWFLIGTEKKILFKERLANLIGKKVFASSGEEDLKSSGSTLTPKQIADIKKIAASVMKIMNKNKRMSEKELTQGLEELISLCDLNKIKEQTLKVNEVERRFRESTKDGSGKMDNETYNEAMTKMQMEMMEAIDMDWMTKLQINMVKFAEFGNLGMGEWLAAVIATNQSLKESNLNDKDIDNISNGLAGFLGGIVQLSTKDKLSYQLQLWQNLDHFFSGLENSGYIGQQSRNFLFDPSNNSMGSTMFSDDYSSVASKAESELKRYVDPSQHNELRQRVDNLILQLENSSDRVELYRNTSNFIDTLNTSAENRKNIGDYLINVINTVMSNKRYKQ